MNYTVYYWMSYYNASLRNTAYAFDFALSTDYDNNYQYDGGVLHYSAPSSGETTKGANVFQAKASEDGEILSSILFESFTANTAYEVKIYVSVDENA